MRCLTAIGDDSMRRGEGVGLGHVRAAVAPATLVRSGGS